MTTRRYICLTSGLRLPRWQPACAATCGRCNIVPDSSMPDAVAPEPERPRAAAPAPRPLEPESPSSTLVSLANVPRRTVPRLSTGLAPFDAVLGGGLPESTFVLFSGEPGAGKTTLLMQALAGSGVCVVYATGEENAAQVSDRAHRIEVDVANFNLTEETELSAVFAHAEAVDARIIAIDSIQTVYCKDVSGGERAQIVACTKRLMRYAKQTGRSVISIGHVTSDGNAAGPAMLRHMVDVVLDLDKGSRCSGNERLLRGPKNRFGATNVVGRFEMTAVGLVPLADEPEPEDSAPNPLGAIGAELGDSVDGELPDTIANRLLRAAVRLADVVDAEADVETIGGGPLALSQRFGVATEALHEAAKAFARGIPEPIRRRLGT